MRREDEIKILFPEKEIKIRGIKVKVRPFSLETAMKAIQAVAPSEAISPEGKVDLEKAGLIWDKMLKAFLDKIQECCNLSKKTIENLTDGEKLEIINTALELDPLLPKNLLLFPERMGFGVER